MKEDLYKRYLIVAADRKKAFFFTFYLGELEDHIEVFDKKIQVPQKVKSQRMALGREDKILRHIEDHIHRHLKFIMQELIKFTESKKINYLVLGGHKEFIPKIEKHLPKSLKSKIIGKFITGLKINKNEIIKKAKRAIEREIN